MALICVQYTMYMYRSTSIASSYPQYPTTAVDSLFHNSFISMVST